MQHLDASTAGDFVVAAGLALAGLGAPLALRAEGWRACLPGAPPRSTLLRWTAAAFALNQLVGFRSGDVLRTALAGRRCGAAVALGSVAVFKAGEVAALLLFAAAFAGSLVGGAGAAAAAGAGLAALLLLASLLVRRMRPALLRPLAQLRPDRFVRLLVLALLALGAEALVFVAVGRALGVSIGWSAGCVLVAASLAGQAAALLPANLGTWDAAVAAALAALGLGGPVLWLVPLWTRAVRMGACALLLPLAFAVRSEARQPQDRNVLNSQGVVA